MSMTVLSLLHDRITSEGNINLQSKIDPFIHSLYLFLLLLY